MDLRRADRRELGLQLRAAAPDLCLKRLPLGIQAIAKQANDGLLLQLAAQIERALEGKWNGGKKPKVHVG